MCSQVDLDCQFSDVFLLGDLDGLTSLLLVFVCHDYLFLGVGKLDEVAFVEVA